MRGWVLLGLAIAVLTATIRLEMASSDRVWGQASPIESPLVSPTPTRVPRTVNEVVHPGEGDALAGEVEIIGTALIADFMRYDIHIARAYEDRWAWVASSTEVVHDDVLHVLNTRGYGDGRYNLRVRAVDMRGNFTEEFVYNLEIRNSRPPTPTPDPNATPAPRSPLPTPTPTPDMTIRMPGGTGFYAPDFGAVLRGTVDIVGAVSGQFRNPLMRWDVAISGHLIEEWVNIRSGSEAGIGITLIALDTTQYEDGLYDLRLRATFEDGSTHDYFLRQLSFANRSDPQFAFMPQPGIIAPRSGDFVSGLLAITANIPQADLMHWELAAAPEGQENWELLTTGDQGVREGELVRLDLSRLVSGRYDLRLRIVRRNREPEDYFVRGLQVEGLPPQDETENGTEADSENSIGGNSQ